MKRIKFVLIHLLEFFDYYILHNTLEPLTDFMYERNEDLGFKLFELHQKVCCLVCDNDWWDYKKDCYCFHCKKFK